MDVIIDDYLKEADLLCLKCDNEFANIDGSLKLKRKIESEKKFLNSLKKCDIKVKEASLKCLNLMHLKAIVKSIESLDNVVSIYKPFKDESNNALIVDIVFDHGYKWLKVLARNPQALHFKFYVEFDTEIVRQAEQFNNFAELNKFNYKIPVVIFNFSNGITHQLASHLSKYIQVQGENVKVNEKLEEKLRFYEENRSSSSEQEDDDDFYYSKNGEKRNFNSQSLDNKPFGDIKCLNLDVSTLLALVSDLTNGNKDQVFDKDYLNQQVKSEKESPLIPILENFMKDKELFVCETAFNDFKSIVQTVGGKNEKERFEKIKNRFKIVPDNPSEKVMQLKENKKVKHRTKIIFGTGESLKAITTTANSGFVRSANNQGVVFSVYLHFPRALTEQKTEKLKQLDLKQKI